LNPFDNQAGGNLPEEGFVRLKQFVGRDKPIPISTSTWWEWVKAGKAPKPIKLGPNMTAWRVEDIRALIEGSKSDPGPGNE